MKEQQEKWRKSRNRDYRKFLATFKTEPCQYTETHYIEYCQYYHSNLSQKSTTYQGEEGEQREIVYSDRRRSPYNNLNQFTYSGVMCMNNCGEEGCRKCHNAWQYNYHPDNFKTMNCELFYNCRYQFCSKLHSSDYIINQKTNATNFAFSQFFRFNLDTFKTMPCQKLYPHEKSFCYYYHSQKDYRRPNFSQYQHTECPQIQKGAPCNNTCSYSHNKIEQLYHPRRYKSKFCEKHYISRKNSANPNDEATFKSLCPFNKLCSFAHNDEEITINLIDKLPRNLEFFLYMYKTVWCPITTDHNRSQCVYAHNIQDFRRNPKQKHYQPVECPYWKKNQNIKCLEEAGCPAGLDCDKCHGWKQREYHPIIYLKIKPGQEKSDGQASLQVKSRTDSQVKKQTPNSQLNMALVSKKLQSGGKKNNLQQIVQKQLQKKNTIKTKQQLYLPGTPFFKNNKQTGKKKTQSQKGDSATKEETDEKMSQMEERGSFITTKSIAMKSGDSYMNFHGDSKDLNDEDIFKAFSGFKQTVENSHESGINLLKKQTESDIKVQRLSRTVSKSLGCRRQKSKNFYSKDITQLLSPEIVGVLQQQNISQIKLINMPENQIRKINQLTNSQKNLIVHKIVHTRDQLKKTPTYEESLIKFFSRHKKDNILSKMKVKKVKQEKLLLLDSQIWDLSFLTENQKKELPQLLRQLTNHRDFESLNEDIEKTLHYEKSQDQS